MKNKTIMEELNVILHDQDLPMHLWEELTRKYVYVQKKTPHYVLDNKNLEEYFSGDNLKVIHLKIFVFHVYIHIPKEMRTKLYPSRNNRIFVGYSDTLETYRIYFPGFKKIETN